MLYKIIPYIKLETKYLKYRISYFLKDYLKNLLYSFAF
jgi:hypothetical protein